MRIKKSRLKPGTHYPCSRVVWTGTRVHGPWTRAVNTGRVHGREHGPCSRPVLKKALSCNAFINTATGVKRRQYSLILVDTCSIAAVFTSITEYRPRLRLLTLVWMAKMVSERQIAAVIPMATSTITVSWKLDTNTCTHLHRQLQALVMSYWRSLSSMTATNVWMSEWKWIDFRYVRKSTKSRLV